MTDDDIAGLLVVPVDDPAAGDRSDMRRRAERHPRRAVVRRRVGEGLAAASGGWFVVTRDAGHAKPVRIVGRDAGGAVIAETSRGLSGP